MEGREAAREKSRERWERRKARERLEMGIADRAEAEDEENSGDGREGYTTRTL